MIRISNPLINSSQDGSQDAGAGQRGDSQDGQQDGMAHDGSQDGPDRSPKSGGKSRMKLKSMRSVDKISDEGYVVPTPDRKVTEEQLRAAFEKIDIQGCGELDKEEIGLAAAEVGAVWNDKQLQHAFNMMDDDGNTNGFADFEEFASFWLGKGWEELRDEDNNATKPAASFVSTVTQLGPCGKIGQLLRKNVVSGVDKKKEKQVEPESVFVMSAEGSGLDGARAELMDKIQQIHENEFHQLEDLLNTHAESRVEAEVWERCPCFRLWNLTIFFRNEGHPTAGVAAEQYQGGQGRSKCCNAGRNERHNQRNWRSGPGASVSGMLALLPQGRACPR